MKFILISISALALLTAPAHAAKAPSASCFVSPDPVVVGADFTIMAYGLTPLGHYYINVTGQKDSSNGAHPQTTEQADLSGVLVYTRNTNAGPDAILGVGRAKVRLYPNPDYNDASGTVNCWFSVV